MAGAGDVNAGGALVDGPNGPFKGIFPEFLVLTQDKQGKQDKKPKVSKEEKAAKKAERKAAAEEAKAAKKKKAEEEKAAKDAEKAKRKDAKKAAKEEKKNKKKKGGDDEEAADDAEAEPESEAEPEGEPEGEPEAEAEGEAEAEAEPEAEPDGDLDLADRTKGGGGADEDAPAEGDDAALENDAEAPAADGAEEPAAEGDEEQKPAAEENAAKEPVRFVMTLAIVGGIGSLRPKKPDKPAKAKPSKEDKQKAKEAKIKEKEDAKAAKKKEKDDAKAAKKKEKENAKAAKKNKKGGDEEEAADDAEAEPESEAEPEGEAEAEAEGEAEPEAEAEAEPGGDLDLADRTKGGGGADDEEAAADDEEGGEGGDAGEGERDGAPEPEPEGEAEPEAAGKEAADPKAAFIVDFQARLAKALGIEPERVTVTEVKAGPKKVAVGKATFGLDGEDGFNWPSIAEAQEHRNNVFPRSFDGKNKKLKMFGDKPNIDHADTETMGLIGGVGLRIYFEFLEAYAKLFFFLACLSMPCVMLNYTGDGLDGLQAPGFQAKLGRTTFGNLYPPVVNITGRIRDCSEFENSKCCEDEVSGVMIGMRNDVTGCAQNMQELLYGLYCNATFWSPEMEFNICDGLCDRVYSACDGVDVMVPDSSVLRRRAQVQDSCVPTGACGSRAAGNCLVAVEGVAEVIGTAGDPTGCLFTEGVCGCPAAVVWRLLGRGADLSRLALGGAESVGQSTRRAGRPGLDFQLGPHPVQLGTLADVGPDDGVVPSGLGAGAATTAGQWLALGLHRTTRRSRQRLVSAGQGPI